MRLQVFMNSVIALAKLLFWTAIVVEVKKDARPSKTTELSQMLQVTVWIEYFDGATDYGRFTVYLSKFKFQS